MTRSILEILTDLEEARADLVSAEQRESFARLKSTDALNRVNTLQGEFDRATAGIRKSAPRRSDWASPPCYGVNDKE